MNDLIGLENGGIQELTVEELRYVSGAGGGLEAGAAAAGIGAIGAATWGGTWGAVGVATAFAAAPIAVIGMAVLAAWGGYHLWRMS